jgi:hypothetical protein
VATPGYPEEVIVECIEPLDYIESWTYGIWMKGRYDDYLV